MIAGPLRPLLSGRPDPVGAALLVVALALLSACGISTTRVLEGTGPRGAEPAALARRADEAFAVRPREVETVREAFREMSGAVRATEASDSTRHRYASRAARFAVWLAGHTGGSTSEAYADSAVVLANTALRADSSRVEPYYWRAIASGLYARHNRLTAGRDAMSRIREDATAAIRIDPTFEHGGPHRVLGTLYLRAPGPPTGVGSLRRALHHLERAREVAPDHPENLLPLAEAYLEAGRRADAEALLEGLLQSEIPFGDEEERTEWRTEAGELLERVRTPG
ncbi:MAG: tetratricopeptide repeat protein [Gemmatimonadetes bacterium]|nr:tetratricopeptide repeat protein [Gemmatimonadota bacterium]NIR80557.1 tetratricopeptide repeat protein [Gemmatimonadota bacterium]NIT89322.1 tetratricopeptide repeat protein [Gemmatimonadota bacterium]NIU33128.1 tetratricopeptide repeat protein [Gemmatimonadota bacterium]NIU37493.1 tetratricopeptide repeat protein [Gemmatimonadota bacterium]